MPDSFALHTQLDNEVGTRRQARHQYTLPAMLSAVIVQYGCIVRRYIACLHTA
jgi:hypothetical protein